MGTVQTIRNALQGFSIRWVLTDDMPDADGVPKVNPTDVLFDVTRTFNRAWPGDVADHPIEKGSDISDHNRRRPQSVTMSILLTPNPIVPLGLFEEDVDRRVDKLIEWWENTEVLKLVGKQVVKNVLIESLSENKDPEVGDGRMFNMTIKQIKIVDTDNVLGAGGITDPQEEAV